jgi:hypothetical protein
MPEGDASSQYVRGYFRQREPKPVEDEETLDVDKLEWPDFRRRFRRLFEQGHQVVILGGPDAGKTHLAVLLAEIRTYDFMLVTKPRDPIVLQMLDRGWTISSTLAPAEQLVGDENDPRYGTPIYPRFVYWPQPLPNPELTLRQDSELKAAQIQAALMVIKRHGSWCLVVDELNYLSQTLGLRDDLAEMYHTARSNKVSIIGAAQRPSWIPRAAVDNPSHIFIFQAGDRDEIRRLGEIGGGLNWKLVSQEIADLDWRKHEFLYANPHRRLYYRSHAPPW